jgi:hypothetical protein
MTWLKVWHFNHSKTQNKVDLVKSHLSVFTSFPWIQVIVSCFYSYNSIIFHWYYFCLFNIYMRTNVNNNDINNLPFQNEAIPSSWNTLLPAWYKDPLYWLFTTELLPAADDNIGLTYVYQILYLYVMIIFI